MSAIESARQLDSLRHLAAHDPLTGLRNRRGFEPGIDAHLDALGSGGELSLLVVDLDHFKRVNDTLGHDAGDDVLRHFADVLRAASGDGDVPTRLGGEEFALVLPGAGEARALAVAEHLRLLVRTQFATFACPVSVSVGVATRGAEARDASELMRAANRALYAAKRLGRDRCVVHHAQTLEMLAALRDAEGAGAEQLAAAMLLAETLDLRDVATARHSETVGRYSEQIARELQFELARVERIRAAGILHDIGKLGIADAVLHKPGPLDPPEWVEIKRHSEIGSRILEHANLRDIGGWVLAHHERMDGGGYPQGLPGGEIPVEARILAVADAYEAMTADRPYRLALTVEDGARGAAPRRRHAVRRRHRRGVRAHPRPHRGAVSGDPVGRRGREGAEQRAAERLPGRQPPAQLGLGDLRVEAERDRVGVVAERPEPVEQDLARDLGMELHAPRGRPDAEAVDRDRRAGEQRRVLGQLDTVGVPAVGAEALGERAEQRVRGGRRQRLDLVPADLRVETRTTSPPAATASSCAPRQTPSSGWRRSSAAAISAISSCR